MSVLSDDIANALGRPIPLLPTEESQIQAWLDRALYLVKRAAAQRGVPFESLDEDDVDYVIATTVEQYARSWRPDSASRHSVRVDDGSVDRSYFKDVGALSIDAGLLDGLFPEAIAGAFSIGPPVSYRAPGSEFTL